MAEMTARPLTGLLRPTPLMVLAALGAVLLVLMLGFMTLGARGNWDFILAFRGRKLLALILVAHAVALSTVLFQTVSGNRILTPAIMGFDALYILLQTVLVFTVGGFAVLTAAPLLGFALETAVMLAFAGLIYGLLFLKGQRDLHLVLLVGIVLATLFRALTDLMQRLIDPNEFAILQDLFFASFNAVDTDLLGISALILIIGTGFAWTRFSSWDVLTLGRATATGLGVDARRETILILGLVTILVSVSTALVGPITFFGLLVANLAYLVMPSHRHAHIVPAASLIAMIALISGQMVVERLFGFNTSLAIVIEFAGGLTLIWLLIRRSRP